MRISFNWIKQYVDVDASPAEVAKRLTMAGLEVEGLENRYPVISGVIAGRIEAVVPHPDAETLKICRMSTGSETMDVVCGAPNAAPGLCVPLALEGAQLPSGLRIGRSTIRGIVSGGMLCSEKELGLSEEGSGVMVLEGDTVPGTLLEKVLSLEDFILEIGLTPNRPDCMSALGIAREVAALFGARLRYPPIRVPETGPPVQEAASVTILDPKACPRYAARLVRGVRIGPSPYWLREKLHSTGIRSINNVVDVTNYVLMEFGQPLHAFDFQRLEEHRIVVRRARVGERFSTLDGVERGLPEGALLICDGRRPVALAGIMGGLNSEIEETTRDVLIESAYFDPVTIRRTSKKLGLSTEASYRFERGIDPGGVVRAVDRCAQFMVELAGGEASRGVIDVYPEEYSPRALSLRVSRTNDFLGTSLSARDMARYLDALELEVNEDGEDRLQVTCPTFRRDLEREVDLVEEVARLYGYDAIPVSYPSAHEATAPRSEELLGRLKAARVARSAGFHEVVNYSFISPAWFDRCGFRAGEERRDAVPVLNPLSEDQSVMRTTLLPGLLGNVQRNAAFRNTDLKLFELGRIYLPRGATTPAGERHVLAAVHSGLREPFAWCRDKAEADFWDIKGAVSLLLDEFRVEGAEFEPETETPPFAPEESARLLIRGSRVGALGRISDAVRQAFDIPFAVYGFELDLDALMEFRGGLVQVRSLPKFPAVARDLAVVVSRDTASAAIERVIRNSAPDPYLEGFHLFDVYRGDQIGSNEVSLAYRIVYRAEDRTLNDEEVNRMHESLIQAVLKSTGGRLRG